MNTRINSREVGSHAIAALAAQWVVDEGLTMAAAKQRAADQLGLRGRIPWPDEASLDAAVREHIAIFCPEEQALALAGLRQVALRWLERLADCSPYVSGSVWHGTATRHSDVFIQLFVDDEKSVEWVLLDKRVNYHPGSAKGWRGEMVPVLTVPDVNGALGEPVLVHLMLHPSDDVRGALKPDAMGRAPRGGAAALRELMEMNT
jgi:hypothetical protein